MLNHHDAMTCPSTRRTSHFAKAILLLIFVSAFSAMGNVAEGEAPKLFAWRPFLAPFHAVVLHLPIGFITVAFVLEIYRWVRHSEEIKPALVLVTWLSLFTGIVSAVLGLLRAQSGGYEIHALNLHRAFGLGIPFITFATLILQKLAYRRATARGWIAGYRLLLAGNLALVIVAGHLGGNLTHGSQYLVENAPKFVRELIADVPEEHAEASSAGLSEHKRNYVEKVEPIFRGKCYSCHGTEKQKGGYRLDQPTAALKGGQSEKPAIQPGDVMASHLVRLILLPPGHDDIMPPSGKEPLTSDEIMIVLDWIRNGAVFLEDAPPLVTSKADETGVKKEKP